MIKWIRPSGSVIELADTPNLNDYAESAGWKRDTVLVQEPIDGLELLSKNELESQAKELFGVDLDKRKSEKTLRKEMRELVRKSTES